jgi:hypothetical protein
MRHNKKGKDNIVDDNTLSDAVTNSLKQLPDRNRNDYNDMFYTNTKVFEKAADWIEEYILNKKNNSLDKIVTFGDFSAGDGSFGKILKTRFSNIKYHGIDICPTSKLIKTQDFLSLNLNDSEEIKYWKEIVGFNPPFGRAGILAKKFINHVMSVRPVYILTILPVRDYIYHGYEIIKEEFLEENSFYTFDNKELFSTASILILLKKIKDEEQENNFIPFISEFSVQTNPKIPYIVNDIPRLELPIKKNNYLLLTRKVGHYAGKQNYLINISDDFTNKYNVIYTDIKGIFKQWNNIELKFDINQKWDENNNKEDNKNLPWEENGHIVCIHDKAANTKRSGIGFLKTQLILNQELLFEEKVDLLSKINKFFNENPLSFGTPKSINCAILSVVLHKVINF